MVQVNVWFSVWLVSSSVVRVSVRFSVWLVSRLVVQVHGWFSGTGQCLVQCVVSV